MTEEHHLTDEEKARFEKDGYVILRDVVPAQRLEAVRQVFVDTVDKLAKQWRDEGFVTNTADDEPFERRFAVLREQLPPRFPTSWRRVLVSPAVYGLWQEPALLGRIRDLIGDEVFAHGVWNGRPREPGNVDVQRIGWHQDAHYYRDWNDDDGDLVTMWMPLVPVDVESGCLQILPGSHTRGWIPPVRSANNLHTVADEDLAGGTPVTAVMDPGDALLFTDKTLHRALDNNSDRVRWSIDIRFGQATPEVMSKTPRGYICHSAADPSRVESYETWEARYDYGLAELAEELEKAPTTLDVAEVAARMGTSRSELESF